MHHRQQFQNVRRLDPLGHGQLAALVGHCHRVLMTFAAYNAGPGNLRRFRAEAAKMGLDPNVWFDNVEQAAARIVGHETVQYVGNIYKYYVAYTLAEHRAQEARAAGGK